jgi:hypothetical protein
VLAVGAAAVAVTALMLGIDHRTLRPNAARTPVGFLRAYRAPSKDLIVNLEMRFTRLSDSQLAKVRISPERAVRIASAPYGRIRSRVVFESLGGYVDDNQIVPDWVGTTSWVPKPLPSYLVRIYLAQVVTVDPSHNHYWNVTVNATNGKLVSSTSYD